MDKRDLLALCHDLIERARSHGASEAEAIATWDRSAETTLENGDVHSAQSTEETTFGLRALDGRRMGFVTANRTDPQTLDACVREAVAQSRATPADPFNVLPEPELCTEVDGLYDASTASIGVGETTAVAADLVERVRQRDTRVRIDSGSVGVSVSATALVSTSGIERSERQTVAHGYLFGMAVDGDDVASFDYDGDASRVFLRVGDLLHASADRFVDKCVAGLGAGKGRSFKGAIVLSPEAVGEFLLPNLIAAISADAVRKGRSRLAGKVGEAIASESLTIIDDGTRAGGIASSPFDREGVPLTRRTLVDRGTLTTYLYNTYEAAAAAGEARSTGHATGSAASLPGIGPSFIEIGAGSTPAADLTSGADVTIHVGRFSGSSNPVTGEFSGVAKNAFLVERGDRHPVRETLIAGNLFEVLQRTTAISSERRLIGGTRLLPSLRIDGVSVTAG